MYPSNDLNILGTVTPLNTNTKILIIIKMDSFCYSGFQCLSLLNLTFPLSPKPIDLLKVLELKIKKKRPSQKTFVSV